MRKYSIKELENYTGIKAHTIRIWEQRYNLLDPKRTDTGYRYYDDEQLKKILTVNTLLKAGYKISKISELSKNEINLLIKDIEEINSPSNSTRELILGKLITAGLNFNEQEMEYAFRDAIEIFDEEDLPFEIYYPLLHRIGLMWEIDAVNPLQEHFISHFIRQKLITSLDKIPFSSKEFFDIVLFLPEYETHEISLLVANYILRKKGAKVLYLGQQVPTKHIIQLITEMKIPKALCFAFINHGEQTFDEIFAEIHENCSDTKLFWSGAAQLFKNKTFSLNNLYIDSPDNFYKLLANEFNE